MGNASLFWLMVCSLWRWTSGWPGWRLLRKRSLRRKPTEEPAKSLMVQKCYWYCFFFFPSPPCPNMICIPNHCNTSFRYRVFGHVKPMHVFFFFSLFGSFLALKRNNGLPSVLRAPFKINGISCFESRPLFFFKTIARVLFLLLNSMLFLLTN